VFVSGKPLQSSLMLADKAGAYPRVEHLKAETKGSTRIASVDRDKMTKKVLNYEYFSREVLGRVTRLSDFFNN
jgi:hypothetical protein